MPTLDIERKESTGMPMWLWVVLGVLLLGLIGWLLATQPWRGDNLSANVPAVGQTAPDSGVADMNADNPNAAVNTPATDAAAEPGTTAAQGQPGAAGEQTETGAVQADGAWFPLEAIRANPDAYFGKTVTGVATVTEVVGNWGFWAERDGTRMFILKNDPSPSLNAGQRVSVTGTVRSPHPMEKIPAIFELPEATRQNLQNAPAFIEASKLQVLAS